MYVAGVKMAVFTIFLQKNTKKNLAIFPQRIILSLVVLCLMNAMHSLIE